MRLFLLASVLIWSPPAFASNGWVYLPNGQRVGVDSAYRKGNQIRVFGQGRSGMSVASVQQALLTRMAELARAKNMPRMAVVKVSDCGYQGYFAQCRFVGQMLTDGEQAAPEGKNEIVYYRVADILSGILAEESRTPGR